MALPRSLLLLVTGQVTLLVLALAPVRGGVVLSEFVASNATGLQDEDGETSDWIELYNDDTRSVSLAGWSLTDDAGDFDKWVFPEVEIGAGEFLVVFASGKDRRDPAGTLHTSFKLSSGGEYLALIAPGPRPVTVFSPAYPPQRTDTSYGRPMDVARTPLVEEGAAGRYLVPENRDLGDTWVAPEFDDAAWAEATTGLGYDLDEPPVIADLVATGVETAMYRESTSLYLRIPFDIEAGSLASLPQLRMRYAHGFVAFLNGVEVIRENLRGTTLAYNSRAASTRTPEDARQPAALPVTTPGLLREGRNVLAIQALNYSTRSDQFLILPELEVLEASVEAGAAARFFESPTPAWPNSDGASGLLAAPEITPPGGGYTEAVALTVGVGDPLAEIRYTTDGTVPTEESPLYEGPFSVSSTAVVSARAFREGYVPSPVVTEGYVMLHSSLASTSSNLPAVIVNTFGTAIPASGVCDGKAMHIHVVDRGEGGRAHLTGRANFSGLGVIKERGSSTQSRAKASYRFEIQDGAGNDRAVDLLDFPRESDFILYGAYNFDQALMRNAFIYEISNQVGRYAARTRFVELWVNQGRGTVSSAHYMGVYSLMEVIKRDAERVDISKLLPTDLEEPEVTGGYIFKVDRADPCGTSFSGGGLSFQLTYPKAPAGSEALAAWNSDQKVWLAAWLNQLNSAVRTRDPARYEEYIDVESWIDHHILNVFPKNVDAFRLSGYMYKDRGERLEMGPIWDYDRTMGSTDGRDRDPRSWPNTGGDGGTAYFAFGWYGPLFGNVPPTGSSPWATQYRARWRELRAGPISTENIVSVIDRMEEEIGEAASRNWTKWRQGSSNFAVPVNTLRNWLTTRVEWIDSEFIDPPTFLQPGGIVEPGFLAELEAPAGDIYYTLNGPDPRGTGGDPAAEAQLYSGPIPVTANTRVQARVLIGGSVWSEIVSETFVTDPLPLVITEVMYNPAPRDDGGSTSDLEFVEILNVGDEPVDLSGVSLAKKRETSTRLTVTTIFEFALGDVSVLDPGEYVLVARDAVELAAAHEHPLPIAGEYSGTLSNTKDWIAILGPLDETVFEIEYWDDEDTRVDPPIPWHPSTDGDGYSLVLLDPRTPPEAGSDPTSWAPSREIGGSPGLPDGPIEEGGQVPGDLNQDGRLNISDAAGLLLHLFAAGPALPCSTEEGNRLLLDLNDDGGLDLADAVFSLEYIFRDGAPPALGISCVPILGCPEACTASAP